MSAFPCGHVLTRQPSAERGTDGLPVSLWTVHSWTRHGARTVGGRAERRRPGRLCAAGLMSYKKPKRIPFLSLNLRHSRFFERRSVCQPSRGRRQVTRREPAHARRTCDTSKSSRVGYYSKWFHKMLIARRFQVLTLV